MNRITDDIYLIEGRLSANVFLLNSQDGFYLIDSGIFKETDKLIRLLDENGFLMEKLKMIILTHCHCDHIGGVAELVRCSGAKVAAHFEDMPFILQEAVIPGPYNKMMVYEQRVMKQFNCNIKHVDIALKDGDILDIAGGLQVIHVPGHTPGSIALYQGQKRIMFFGDVIRNNANKGLTIGIPEKFNVDTRQVIADAGKLLNYPIEYALFGHGAAVAENASDLLQRARKPEEVLKNRTKDRSGKMKNI